MTIILSRSSTKYIFLLSGLSFLLWSLATSVTPYSTILSAFLHADPFGTAIAWQHFVNTTHAAFSNVSISNNPTTQFIGVPRAHIYVVSLADRQDRREQMEYLRTIQGLTWTIIDAVPGNASLVDSILGNIARHRFERNQDNNGNSSFRWPEDINALAISQEPLQPSGSDAWAETTPPSEPGPWRYSNLTCATEDDTVPTFANDTPLWMVLSPAKIACWHSHVLAIRRFVDRAASLGDDHRGEDVAIIFEDDIDMEKDISTRLSPIWTFLPAGWDIVFLGHCWSDESHHPSLTQFADTNVHPSHYPKCTHAYALSHSGARRLLQHLRYPPFAYSRALDQAYAWLVRSGRLRGYSIVPSLVVQRKSVSSDILPGLGSEWKQGLRNGAFEARTI